MLEASGGKSVTIPVTQGSTIYIVDGQEVKADQLLAEVAIGSRTNRAHTKKQPKT
jgi:DNA-directed RNA polymerase subunit beta'